ncbi:MAG: hypothetical protein ACRDGF_10650 [Chloroflexota bacterium]
MRRGLWLLLPLALLAGCGGSTTAPSIAPTPTPVYAPKPSATYVIQLQDAGRFVPAKLRGQPGQLVKLVLKGDHRKHDFTSPSLNVNIDVLPESVEIIDVKLPATPGIYDFWSAQPGDREAGMTGQFVVAVGGSASSSPAAR